jgi:hypothetical protein
MNMKVTRDQIIKAAQEAGFESGDEMYSLSNNNETDFNKKITLAEEYRCGDMLVAFLHNLGVEVE